LRATHFAGRYHTFFRARVTTFGLIVGVAWLAEKERLLPLLLCLPAVAFVTAVLARNRAYRAWLRAARAVRFYEQRLANLEDPRAGAAETGIRFLDDIHPYARDLDLFGPGSLFQRLHLAGTPLGENTLAAWLRTPVGAEEVRIRQAAVAELRERLDLREDLALLGKELPAGLDIAGLAARVANFSSIGLRPAQRAIGAISVVAALTLFVCFLRFGSVLALVGLALSSAVALWERRHLRHSLPNVTARGTDLNALLAIFARLEREPFTSDRLRNARAGIAAARPLAGLARLLRTVPFALEVLPFAGSLGLLLALKAWQNRYGDALASWLAALGELEALNALAAYSYETPAAVFPEILDEGPCFEADRLGHPLLPITRCVRNDVRLNSTQRLLIVSGSNMSGKSTLLRTVGANVVLAMTGAPVCATRLRLSPLMPGATLRVQDSLLDGRSRFFAEVTRIRQLLDLARTPPPLLVLLDELFSGTNSDDRRQGAVAVVRHFIDCGAVGLLTTHDLALTHLADLLAPHVTNVHFLDQFRDGVMNFDYQMRPGVLQSGNGLTLMRAVGIEV
jgi:hypothetical protein